MGEKQKLIKGVRVSKRKQMTELKKEREQTATERGSMDEM